jgi:flagellar biosynthetic protein FlhB
MASDKTEAPTPRRLEDARAEGQVARSIELNSAAILLAGTMLLRGPAQSLVQAMRTEIITNLTVFPQGELNYNWVRNWAMQAGLALAPGMLIVSGGLLVVGVGVTVAQTNFMWTSKKIGFDFKRVNPVTGLQRIFSKQGLVELGKALLKLGLVGYVAYSFLAGQVQQFLQIGQSDVVTGVGKMVELAGSLAMRVGAAYLVLAIADYVYQRYRFMNTLKMSKQEVKEDMKRSEGDPFLRGRIRAQQRKIARQRMMSNVHKASVVLTNPTHLAVAIEYSPEKMGAPRVVAKGAYEIAHRIVAIAKENNIPVVQNIPLARAIYRVVDVDQEIPPDLYMAVAEVLAYVYRLRAQSMGVAQSSQRNLDQE